MISKVILSVFDVRTGSDGLFPWFPGMGGAAIAPPSSLVDREGKCDDYISLM